MNNQLEIYEYLLNISNLQVEQVDILERELHIFCKIRNKESQKCPVCQQSVFSKRFKYVRQVRDLDISGRKVILHLSVHQYNCDCKRSFSEVFDFVESGKSYTNRQAKWIFEMSAQQSHVQVGSLTDTCPKTVERISYRQVVSRKINWDKIKRIGIDEFAFKKGHKDFIVLIINLDTHEIIDILEKRDKEFLRAYFKGIGSKFCNQIEDFCSDMWGPFQDLAKEIFPNAAIHVDRFHWTIHLNKVVDNARKSLRRKDPEEEAYKGLKWKLIKRPENLNEEEVKDLKKAFALSPELEDLYEMRNTFQAIFDTNYSYDFAEIQIDNWLEQASVLKNKYLDKFTQLFDRHRKNILNYFKNKISTGAVEGTNNLLRTVKRFTFNMTNFQHFKCRVFAYKN
jgi:transposase